MWSRSWPWWGQPNRGLPPGLPTQHCGGMTDDTTSKLAIIIGSVRDGRFGPVVASWLADQAAMHGGFEVQIIDLADYDIPLSLPAVPAKFAGDSFAFPAGMAPLTEQLAASDAYVLVTPEYNHSYPASLKAAIDWHFTQWT